MRQLNKQFGKIKVSVPIPHLLTLQIDSYKKFLQEGVPTEEREDIGLQGVFRTVFPIEDFNGTSSLEFVKYEIQEPKYDIPECITKGLTYEAPLRIHVRLVLYDVDETNGIKTPREFKEQDIYFGTIPLMTEKGTFIVNGTERVIVNQLQRSPGIIFEHDEGKTHSSHKLLYSCRVIPMRGSWLDFDFDHKDILYVRIDRRRKMPATILFKAMGMSQQEILDYFYRTETFVLSDDGRLFWKVQPDLFRKEPAYADIVAPDGKVVVKQGKEITRGKWKHIVDNKIEQIEVAPDTPVGMFLAHDLKDPGTDEYIAQGGDEISEAMWEELQKSPFKEITVLHTHGTDTSSSIRDTLALDHIDDKEKAQEEIYRRLRPSSPPTPEIAASFFDNLFRNKMYYDLSPVGRYKLTQRLKLDILCEDELRNVVNEVNTLREQEIFKVEETRPFVRKKYNSDEDYENTILAAIKKAGEVLSKAHATNSADFRRAIEDDAESLSEVANLSSEQIELAIERAKKNLAEVRTLRDKDILIAIKHLVELKDSHGAADDIDHLGNRRVRLVGELVENQYRIGLVRMERAIKERMNVQESSQLMPHDLINPKPVGAVLKEFFGTSQLSQFMDQTNALSEVTHKRRLSALGPGGLTRERAGFEVRDVHTSHYGRICPIETPEGPNIGLIVSLTTFARVNDFGFIETPYRVVKDCHVTDEIRPLDASSENNDEVVAQADVRVDENGNLVDEFVTARVRGEVEIRRKSDVTLMDISPSQMVSISAALIPFLEHDDANRALMGSNMQRQAVPLLRSDKPLVGTGMEVDVARDSGACIVAAADGVIQYVDANRIVVAYEDGIFENQGGVKAYDLLKFHKSNQNTCFGQKPTCYPGQHVKKGQILADGPGIDEGVLALGKNLVVAFMPWCGYNYEDSILISERAVKDDIFTSIHIEEFEVVARDTKLGPEEITCDIPNVGDDMLRNLDESGIIRIGAAVKPEDILVGKITPKGETQLTPEEKLLRAIFGEKARDVKNTSLKVPPGVEGTVIDVKVFNRRSSGEKDKDRRTLEIEKMERDVLDQKEHDHIEALGKRTKELLWPLIKGKQVSVTINGKKRGEVLLEAGGVLEHEQLKDIPVKKLAGIFKSRETNDAVAKAIDTYDQQVAFISSLYENKRGKISEGDDLAPGVIKMVKVHVAIKRKLSVGDKMAGRHGNKGVVSCILPEEDMPFFKDGRSVDIVLNPLGVPSRMNIGQIMETHLGWGAKELGRMLANLVDSGAAMDIVRQEVKDVFASEEINALIDDMDDEEFRQSVRKLRKGIVTRTPVFDSATEDEIWGWMEKANLDNDGKTQLYDGRTGQPFENRVTTGVMYMLKLHHLVDEKIHARSTGPYSLVTQQPLGGKAQFGGQRLGEMEVWALEAYGAAYLLQEFLTVKSDDVTGRVKMYEKIVKGDNFLEAGLPESFNVLVQELKSLALNVTLHEEKEKKSTRRLGFASDSF